MVNRGEEKVRVHMNVVNVVKCTLINAYEFLSKQFFLDIIRQASYQNLSGGLKSFSLHN